MSDAFLLRHNLALALEEAAGLLREHGQPRWAALLEQVAAHPEDERALDRLRGAYGELTDLVLNPGAADDADYLFQRSLGTAWVTLERLAGA